MRHSRGRAPRFRTSPIFCRCRQSCWSMAGRRTRPSPASSTTRSEDQGGATARDEIRRQFGDEVTAIVEGCTDADTVPKPPWRGRKEAYVAHVADTSASVRLVSAADKLHNARAILHDYRELGDRLWSRFNVGPADIPWYYRALVCRVRTDGRYSIDTRARPNRGGVGSARHSHINCRAHRIDGAGLRLRRRPRSVDIDTVGSAPCHSGAMSWLLGTMVPHCRGRLGTGPIADGATRFSPSLLFWVPRG